jgi:hypothetical protein
MKNKILFEGPIRTLVGFTDGEGCFHVARSAGIACEQRSAFLKIQQ